MSSIFCLGLTAAASGAFPDKKPSKTIVGASDGLKLVCDVRGNGDTALVFLHGWCCDREHWKHQVGAFDADYRVVAFDAAGHGESGKDRKEWNAQSGAADVEAVVKGLGLRRVILVGHSAGGVIALMAARRMPGAVVAVVGVDTLHNAERKSSEQSTRKLVDALEKDFKGTMRGSVSGWLPKDTDPELKKWILTRIESQDPRAAIGLMRGRTTVDFATMFKEAGVPIRCINSSRAATTVATNRKYADFEAIVMDGVGHFPMLEKPAEFNRHLRAVLQEFAGRK